MIVNTVDMMKVDQFRRLQYYQGTITNCYFELCLLLADIIITHATAFQELLLLLV